MKKIVEKVKMAGMNFWREEDGIGVVELVLILVILIALVVLFEDSISSAVKTALKTFKGDSSNLAKKSYK